MSRIIEEMRELTNKFDEDQNRIKKLEADIDMYIRALKILCRQREQVWTLDEIEDSTKDKRAIAVHGYGVDLIEL